MQLALIRHGQTDWNLRGVMQGRTDIPLNDTGRAQAEAAVALIDPAEWDLVVSSTLGRARETAAILARGLDLPVAGAYHDLVEQDFGAAEGTPVSEIDVRWPGRAFEGKEPDAEVGPRGVRALERITVDHAGARVLAVAHGTLIRHVLGELSGHEASSYPRLDNLAMSELERAADASWRVRTVGGAPFAEVLPSLLAVELAA
ncbi:putative phosphoglycerate mutase [Agromyces flavus]|uniref:Phosphoglycerate mutase n=1 Tax=Agromyces flavus TaxID=589382 RepID=A0A1H1VUH8_9MICO|nr:histidine phosphatase family protein [Agromyces flavus]MCP2366015.1 putative phosphoglycerate mutase [Agromyces flavus]GGI43829.1 fructose 1,6-bisphosphatase [Agromyces flavus]SDS88564.1 probable phosphoglycerate mutase [Agromyces flavus]